jgi:hypothetical protein
VTFFTGFIQERKLEKENYVSVSGGQYSSKIHAHPKCGVDMGIG